MWIIIIVTTSAAPWICRFTHPNCPQDWFSFTMKSEMQTTNAASERDVFVVHA